MRYRSATVAGFHGLPRCLGLSKERLTSAVSILRKPSRATPVFWRFLRDHPHRLHLLRGKRRPALAAVEKTDHAALAKNISLNLDTTIHH